MRVKNFGDSQTSKTKGKIQSYDIISQKIINMGDGKVLEVIIDASVCLQDKSTSKDILLIGDFTYKNKKLPNLRAIMQSAFSQTIEVIRVRLWSSELKLS